MSQTQSKNIILEPLRIEAFLSAGLVGLIGISFIFFDQIALGIIITTLAILIPIISHNYFIRLSEDRISINKYIPRNKIITEVNINDIDWFSVRHYGTDNRDIKLFVVCIDNKKYKFLKSEYAQVNAVFKSLVNSGYKLYKRDIDGSLSNDYYKNG